ncbi:MAG: cupin domain-containing protein [Leptospirales bacterium]
MVRVVNKESLDPAEILIDRLGLLPHPEGGVYREIFRSTSLVDHPILGKRPSATVIYYLLRAGEKSAWHKIRSEEIWQHLAGGPLSLESLSPDLSHHARTTLSATDQGGASVKVIQGGEWQAARTEGQFTLVLCTVAPGFEFRDLEFLDSGHPLIASLPDDLQIQISRFLRLTP